MEQRILELTIISAKGLKDVKHLRTMHAYVCVKISGGASKTTSTGIMKTPVDNGGGSDPVWNCPMKFVVDEKELQSNLLVLDFRILCSRSVRGDKEVGYAHVPLKDLLDKSGNERSSSICDMTLQISLPFSKPQGELNICYNFIEHQDATRSPLTTALPVEEDQTPAPAGISAIMAQPVVPPNGGLLPAGLISVTTTTITAGFSQTTIVTSEPPLGYPPLGQNVVFPQQVMSSSGPQTMNSVPAFPPVMPTVAPPIATDDPPSSSNPSGIPGVDREKTEYELELEAALAGLLNAIGIKIEKDE